jgi:hypothetical protein
MSTKEAAVITMKQSNLPARSQRRQPTNEQIAKRAYDIFLARGASHGSDLEDWLQAERELRQND